MEYKGNRKNIGYRGNNNNMGTRKPSDKIVYRTDGKKREVEIDGDVAKGIAAALSAILGFAAGLFLL
jgi:hypothetical protein